MLQRTPKPWMIMVSSVGQVWLQLFQTGSALPPAHLGSQPACSPRRQGCSGARWRDSRVLGAYFWELVGTAAYAGWTGTPEPSLCQGNAAWHRSELQTDATPVLTEAGLASAPPFSAGLKRRTLVASLFWDLEPASHKAELINYKMWWGP